MRNKKNQNITCNNQKIKKRFLTYVMTRIYFFKIKLKFDTLTFLADFQIRNPRKIFDELLNKFI